MMSAKNIDTIQLRSSVRNPHVLRLRQVEPATLPVVPALPSRRWFRRLMLSGSLFLLVVVALGGATARQTYNVVTAYPKAPSSTVAVEAIQANAHPTTVQAVPQPPKAAAPPPAASPAPNKTVKATYHYYYYYKSSKKPAKAPVSSPQSAPPAQASAQPQASPAPANNPQPGNTNDGSGTTGNGSAGTGSGSNGSGSNGGTSTHPKKPGR